ncbi:MAG: phosphoribosyltransferase, partial [bacterium]
MRLQDGVWRDRLKAAAPRIALGARALGRGVADLLLPSLAHDSPEAAASPGLTAGAWSRVTFLEDPVCDGCGAGFEIAGGA